MKRQVLLFILLAVVSVAGKDRKQFEKAPLPGQLLAAKKIFVSKGVGATAFTVEGGFDLAFDAFYSDLKSWGRYTFVDNPEDADVVMQVSYSSESGGTHVWSSTNTYTHQTSVYSARIIDAQLTLVVYNNPGKTELWSTSVAPGLARRKKNQEKEMIKAGEKLTANLRERVQDSVSPPSATK